MGYDTLLVERKGHTAFMTLNRPERLNAYNEQMHADLRDFWAEVREDPAIWSVVVTGAGRAFATGADMREASAHMSKGQLGAPRWEYNVDFLRMYNQISPGGKNLAPEKTERREGLWGPPPHKPVIAAVNGICCGDGLGFVYNSDIVICAEEAVFFDPHVTVAISPPGIIALPRLIPRTVGFAVMMLGLDQRLSAKRAYELGMVSEVLPKDQLIPRALEMAEQINASTAPLAFRAVKAVVAFRSPHLNYEAARELCGPLENRVKFTTEDAKEGRKAFLENRRPQFKGR